MASEKRRRSTLSLICVLFYCQHRLLSVEGSRRDDETKYVPRQVHLSFAEAPKDMTVSWTTNASNASTAIAYGMSPQNMSRQTANGETHTYTAGGWKGYLHSATLTNLKPSTTYFYALPQRTEIFSFLSRPDTDEEKPVRFVAYGDMGTPDDRNGPGANATVDFCTSILNSTDFVLHVGGT